MMVKSTKIFCDHIMLSDVSGRYYVDIVSSGDKIRDEANITSNNLTTLSDLLDLWRL